MLVLLPETVVLLGYIYRKYWCDEEEKFEFDKVIQDNEDEYQRKLKEQYNLDKIFESNKGNKLEKNNSLVIFNEKENIFKRILNFIKSKLIQK